MPPRTARSADARPRGSRPLREAQRAMVGRARALPPLHRINPVRLTYIRDQLCRRFGRDAKGPASLAGLSVLDIGCGGGLVCEPLARLGADVTGIDPAAENIEAAKAHASAGGLDIAYEADDRRGACRARAKLRRRAAARSGRARARRAGVPQGRGAAGEAWRRHDPLHAQPHAEILSRSPLSAPNTSCAGSPSAPINGSAS